MTGEPQGDSLAAFVASVDGMIPARP